MRKRYFLLLLSLIFGTTAPAFAFYTFPISSEGTVQITRSKILINEVFSDSENSVGEALKSQCEQAPNLKGGGAYSQVTNINFDKIGKFDSGFGYAVHFVVGGECIIP